MSSDRGEDDFEKHLLDAHGGGLEEDHKLTQQQDIGEAYFDNLPALRRYVQRLMNGPCDTHEVDDIIQDVYVRAYAAKKTEKLKYAKAYLFRIARNLSFKSKAKKSSAVEKLVEDFAAEGIIDNVALQDDHLHHKQRLKVFFEAVSRLPPQCRQVFVLRQIEGCTHQEISKKLGISTSTVEKHIAKGLRLSARYMIDCGYEMDTPSDGRRRHIAAE